MSFSCNKFKVDGDMAKKKRRNVTYRDWITEEGLIKIEEWARDGLINEQIAKNLGVAYSTFREYKNKHSALSAALKKRKEVVDRLSRDNVLNLKLMEK